MSGRVRSFVYESECPCGHTVNVEIAITQLTQGRKDRYLRCADCGRVVLGESSSETVRRSE